jgi:hypothetical protein
MIWAVANEGGGASDRVKGPLVPILIVVAVAVTGFAIYRSSHAGGSSSSTQGTIRAVTTSTVGPLPPPDTGASSTDTSARSNSESLLLVRGDCVRRSTGEDYAGFEKMSCDEGHDGEVAWVGEHPAALGEAFPDVAAWSAFYEQACGGPDGPVATWLGPLASEGGSGTIIYPGAASWSDGDRRVVCIAEVSTGQLPPGRQGVTST